MKTILFVQTNYPGFLDQFHKEFGTKDLAYKLLKKRWDGMWFGQSNFYSKNIKSYGWKGMELIINDPLLQGRWAKENNLGVSLDEHPLIQKIPESIKNYLGLRSWVKSIFFEQVKKLQPDVVYMHDLTILSIDDIKWIKKHTKLIVGQIACPLPLNQSPLYHYDLIISSFPHYVKLFRSMGIKSEYLPWCFEDSIAKTIKQEQKKYDVSFIGGYSGAHSKGNKTMEALARAVNVDFWGYGISGLSKSSPIRKTYHGEVYGKQMYQIMAESKIVVNRHINVAGNVANNMRMFDVTGVGSLLITDNKPNLKEFFVDGKEVVAYKSVADLIKKVRYYLSHPREAKKIAVSGQRRTLTNHTYRHRMKKLSDILDIYLNN